MRARWPILAVLLLGLALRLYHLGYQSLWADEYFALTIARVPYDQLLAALAASEPHPPLYYASFHLWRDLAGESDFALRFLSTVFSVIAVAATYGLGLQLLGRRAALSASLLMAANPFQIWYAQEARMYTVLVALTACSALSFFSALQHGGRRRWILYTVVTALAIFSHYHALFIVVLENVVGALWWLRSRRNSRGWLSSQLVLVALFAFWAYYALQIFRSWQGWMAMADFQTMLTRTFSAHMLGTSFPTDQSALPSLALGTWALLALALLLLRHFRVGAILALYVLVPIGGAWLLGELLQRSMFHERYLIVASPAFYLFVGYGVGWRGWRLAFSLLGAVGVLALGSVSLQHHYFDRSFQKDDLRGLAQYIDSRSRDGDLVVGPITRLPFYQRYAQEALPVHQVPPAASPSELGPDFVQAVSGYRRVWYLPYAHTDADAAGYRWLTENGYPAEIRWFNNARAILVGLAPLTTPERTALDFTDRVHLAGFSFSDSRFIPGDVIGLSAYWQTKRPTGGDLKASIRLLDARGHIYAQVDPVLGQGFNPVVGWKPNESVRDNYGLFVPVDTPPGVYRIDLRLYDSVSGYELPVSDGRGAPLGTSVVLRTVGVELPPQPLRSTAQEAPRQVNATFGGVARLVGYDLSPGGWRAGDRVTLALSWLSLRPNGNDYQRVLRLRDKNGAELAKHVSTGASLPVSRWRPGELVREMEDWRLPSNLPAGAHILSLSLEQPNGEALPLAGGGSQLVLATVPIIARADYRPPSPPLYPTAFSLGDFARLAGYDLSVATMRPGETLRLRLQWQALGETDESYQVFTHLLSADERVWAQRDSAPCAGACPTSAWAIGDTLADDYDLTLQQGAPPGEYRVEVGMYRLSGGQRLPVADHSGRVVGDRVVLDQIIRVP